MHRKVSVAIPTYNRLVYLKHCVESILNQTFQDFDLYVFDNASDEPVEQALQAYNDSRTHFIGSDKNRGVVENYNRIYRYPFESEYLVIFHDDDTMHPNMLAWQASFLDAHKEVVFVVSDLQRVSHKNIHEFARLDKEFPGYMLFSNQYDFVRKAIMSWLRYAFSSAMYRRKVFLDPTIDATRLFKRFSDFADVATLVEISKKGSCAFLAAQLVNYRIHPAQDSKVLKKEYEQGTAELLHLFQENLPAPLSKSDEALMRRYAINFLIRTYADINQGVVEFLRFLKRCREKNLIGYDSFRYIDARGLISLVSILFGNRRIIDAARWARNLLRL